MPEKTEEITATKCIVGRHYIIDNPSLIKVSVIKEKFIDQMPFLATKHGTKILGEHIDWIGQTRAYVICRTDDSVLRRITQADLISQYSYELHTELGYDKKEVLAKAQKIVAEIPQLFTT